MDKRESAHGGVSEGVGLRFMMNKWQEAQLGDFFRIKHGYAFESQYFADAGRYIVLTPGYFSEEGGFRHYQPEKYYTGEVPAEYILSEGDLLVAMTEQAEGLLGSSAFIPKSGLYLHNQRLGLITDLNEEKLDKNYLYQLFNSNPIRVQIQTTASGTKVKHTSPDRIYSVLFCLPPLPEQRKIAAILSTWDEAITLTGRLIAALQRRKQALMQLLLTGQVRFREFEGSEWEEIQLQEIAHVNVDVLSERTDPGSEYFYIDLSSVNQGTIDMPGEKVGFGELPSRARRILHFGDVIMATVRPNLQGFALCDFEPVDVICSTGFALISPNDLHDSEYIYQNLYSNSILSQLQDLVTGSNYPAVNASEVKKLRFPFPSSCNERVQIADVLRACDDEIKLLGSIGEGLRIEKHGLMQQLLTGAVRVAV